jgi:hypothetical protein
VAQGVPVFQVVLGARGGRCAVTREEGRARADALATVERNTVRQLRPWFLLVAMLTLWLAGVVGVTSGCGTVMYLREGTMPDDAAALDQARANPDATTALQEYAVTSQLRAVATHKRVTLPLSIGRVLLSMTLVAAAAMVMSGRRNALSFSLQALVVNGVFSIVSYALTSDVRAQWIGAVVEVAQVLALPPDEALAFRDASTWYWFTRAEVLVLQLGVLGAAAAAILSPKSRLFLSAMAEVERTLDEDE